MLKIYSQSDIGLVRKVNEDACKSGTFTDGSAWAVVCDGMGGANGGNVASGIAVEEISNCVASGYSQGMDNQKIKELIINAVMSANQVVHDMAQSDKALSGMGTTVVVAIISEGFAHIAHAGDSRAYLLLPDGICQVTTDHSMVQEMVEKGDLTQQEAKKHPQKNIITRALGVEASIRIDYREIKFLPENRLLICTDGLSNYLEDEQISSIAKEFDAGELTKRLVTMAKDAGGGDNITVTVIEN